MATQYSDQEIVSNLARKFGAFPKAANYDEAGNLLTLNLSGLDISQLPLPTEIGQLTNLRELSMSGTQLSQLPAEIGRLTNLRELSMSGTQLSQLPPEIGQLTSLQRLSLRNTQLSQ